MKDRSVVRTRSWRRVFAGALGIVLLVGAAACSTSAASETSGSSSAKVSDSVSPAPSSPAASESGDTQSAAPQSSQAQSSDTASTSDTATTSDTASTSDTAASDSATTSDTASTSDAATTSDSSTTATTSTTATSTTPAAPTLLKQGVSGPEVTALQNTLNELGYWNGEADGTYGDLTAQAVMAYQKAAGIAADGVAGPDTQKAIARRIRPEVRTTSGSAIEVDLKAQLVKVVVDGSLKYIFNTSTGSGETYMQKDEPEPQVAITPTGKFAIERSIDGMRTSKLGKLWRPRYFYEGYALHGATYVPNYPASHGCVRLANPVIDFVWSANLAPIGRTVWVY